MTNAQINTDPIAWQLLKSLPSSNPLHMLNLIRLRADAVYPSEHPNHGKRLSGKEAYAAWARSSAPIFKRVGGRQIWLGQPQILLIGPQSEKWDIAFIAEYPGARALVAMNRDPDLPSCMVHRTAALADSRLLCLTPIEPGEGFGEPA